MSIVVRTRVRIMLIVRVRVRGVRARAIGGDPWESSSNCFEQLELAVDHLRLC